MCLVSLVPLWAPNLGFRGGGARMVLGCNLQHMAPFGISTTGCCMVVQHATLSFSALGVILGPPDLDLSPGWPGSPFARFSTFVKGAPRQKKMFSGF